MRSTTATDCSSASVSIRFCRSEAERGAGCAKVKGAARPEMREKAKSERYVGRMGEVKTHQTKQGKLVAEVELTVADPDRPGSSKLVKCAAFGDNAEALQREYQPGQEVTAVGIPHELQRRGNDGREWVERQLYLVQLPKVR